MTGLPAILLSILMIAAFALAAGGIVLVRRGGETRTKGVLMIVAAAVLLGNVLTLTL